MAPRLILVIVGLTAALASCTSEPDPASVYLLPPTQLGDDDYLIQFACEIVRLDTSPDSAAVLGLRGTERLDSEEYTELPFLRIGTYRIGTPDLPDNLDDLAADSADPGSSEPATVKGVDAISFTITTAEPSPVAWPALAWIDGDIAISMLGEGFDPETVQQVAEELTATTREEFLAASNDPSLCDLVNE